MVIQDQEKAKDLFDFSGGQNDSLNALLIKDNELQATSNVFCNQSGGVEKRYGTVAGMSPVGGAGVTFKAIAKFKTSALTYDQCIFLSSDTYLYYSGNYSSGGNPSLLLYCPPNNGTATFTQGSPTVTAVVGTFDTTQITTQTTISADGVTFYAIQSVGASSITLTGNFAGTTVTGGPYYVFQKIGQVAYLGEKALSSAALNGKLFLAPCALTSTGIGYVTYQTTTQVHWTTQLAVAPTLTNIYTHKNYLFGFDNMTVGTTSRLYWSTVLDGTSWPVINFLDVAPDDGGQIQQIITFNDALYIFKDTQIYYLVGEVFDPNNPTYALRRVPNPSSIGCVHPATVKVFQNKILWCGRDGIYALDGIGNITNITRPLLNGTVLGMNNRGFAGSFSAVVWDNKYLMSYGAKGQTYNNLGVICLDEAFKWTKHSASFASDQSFIFFTNGGGSNFSSGYQLWSISNGVHYVVDGTATNDVSTAITATADTKTFALGDFTKAKQIHTVYFAFADPGDSAQAAKADVFVDGVSMGQQSVTFGTANTVVMYAYPIDRQCFSLYLRVTDNTSAKTFRWIAAEIVYKEAARGSATIVTA